MICYIISKSKPDRSRLQDVCRAIEMGAGRKAGAATRGRRAGGGLAATAATHGAAAVRHSHAHHGAKNTSVRFVRLPALVWTNSEWNDDDGSTSSPW